MRVFIAIPLPEPCLETLARMQRQLQTSRAEVRWTAIPSIHLTLKFLGEVDPGIITGMAESLRIASNRAQGFKLQLSGLGSFPNQKNPRIIWCGMQGDIDALARLQKTVETACAEYGFPPENRPFQPHLTLGRIKGRKNLQPLMDCVSNASGPECSFGADRFNIYKSVLKPRGAVYTVLETIELK